MVVVRVGRVAFRCWIWGEFEVEFERECEVEGRLLSVSSEESDEQESIVVMVAREEGPNGGRVWEEEGSRRGVDAIEFWFEEGRTRFARRKVKNAVVRVMVSYFSPGIEN